jgi:hypothetical protein
VLSLVVEWQLRPWTPGYIFWLRARENWWPIALLPPSAANPPEQQRADERFFEISGLLREADCCGGFSRLSAAYGWFCGSRSRSVLYTVTVSSALSLLGFGSLKECWCRCSLCQSRGLKGWKKGAPKWPHGTPILGDCDWNDCGVRLGPTASSRTTTQTVFDILEIPQRARGAGACRRLAKLMSELGWMGIRVRGLTRGVSRAGSWLLPRCPGRAPVQPVSFRPRRASPRSRLQLLRVWLQLG